MILYFLAILTVGIFIGWYCRNYSLIQIWKKKKFLVLEGSLFTITKHINEHVGGD